MNGQPRQAKSFSVICEGNTAKKIKLMEEKSHAFTESSGKIHRKRSLSSAPNVTPFRDLGRQRLAARRVKKVVKRRVKNTNAVQDQRKRYGCCFDSFDIDLISGDKSSDDSEYEEIDHQIDSITMLGDSDTESHYRLLYTIPEEGRFYMQSNWDLCDLTKDISDLKYGNEDSNGSLYENKSDSPLHRESGSLYEDSDLKYRDENMNGSLYENDTLKYKNKDITSSLYQESGSFYEESDLKYRDENMNDSFYENDTLKYKNKDLTSSLHGDNEKGFYEEMFGQYDAEEGEHVYEYIDEDDEDGMNIQNVESSPFVEFLSSQRIIRRRNYSLTAQKLNKW